MKTSITLRVLAVALMACWFRVPAAGQTTSATVTGEVSDHGGKVMDYPLRGAPSPLTAPKLLRDRNGGLWVGTNAHGLVHSYEGRTSQFTQHDGLTSDRVLALFEDREGTIWVAIPEGLDQFRESPVTPLSVPEGLCSPIATSVLAARDGSIWIGTADGLNRRKDGHVTIYRRRNYPGLPDNEIQSLFEDERGRIWVSGFHGLAVFDKETFTAVPSVPPGGVHAIAGDNHGGLWLSLRFASGGYGLVHLVNGRIVGQMPWQKVGGGPGSGLVPEPRGGVWTGLINGGIAYFHGSEIRQLPSTKDGLGGGKVLNVSRSRDGALWAATENGLSRITNGRVATLTTANGLPCNSVHWVIEDDVSSYWLYTRCGLVRIARTDLDAWAADPKRTIRATTFDSADGIRLVALLKGVRPQVATSSDGKIWFVNGDTVSFIDPAHIDINTLPPPVYIEQITADGRTYEATRGLRLPPHARNLAIGYTALSLVAPQKVHFRYKLEGQDPDWRELINHREVQYSNLPPGDYRFRVTASNNSGVWNVKGDVLDFFIPPAYYQTNWFRGLWAAIFLALLWSAYQFRVHQLQKRSERLREVIDTIPGYVWSALPDGSLDFINQRWLEFSGVALEKALGWGWEAAVHPEDRARVVEAWRAAVASGKPMESEARVRRADGHYRWLLIRNVPLRNERGKIVKWYGTSTDIDDRKQAEEALRRLNRELRAISNCSQILLRATDEQSLLDEICRIVCEEADYRMVWVAYAEHDEAKSVRPAAWTGTEEAFLANLGITWADTERGRGPTGTAIRSGKTCCIQDFATDPRMAPWRESAVLRDFRSAIGLPLKDEHANTFGSLTIYCAQPNAFTSEESRLLEELAADLAFGIVTLRSQAARKQAEEALRESETRFRTFVDHAADALFIYDFEQGTIVDVNRKACESLGYTPQELIGMRALAFHLDSDRAQMESVAQRAAAGEAVIDTHWHRRKDGTLFPVEAHTSLYWYGGRRFLLKVARDISDRLRAEEKLRRSEAYLAEGQRLTHTGSFAWSAVTRQATYWSEEQFRIFGLNPQEGIPSTETFWQRIHPEDLDRTRELLLTAADRSMEYEHDHRIVLPDGTVKHIHAIGHPVCDEKGQVTEYVGTSVDITERKRAEEALRASEAYLAEGQRLSHTGSWAFDVASNRYVYASEECLRIFGLGPQEALPTREAVSQLIHPEDWDRVNEGFEKLLREKVDTSSEFRIVLPSGTAKHLQAIRHAVMNDAGDVVKVVGTVIDMTERKRAEEERERLRQLEADLAHLNRVSMLGELAASIAHEVNQPLSGVVSNGNACLRWLAADTPNVEEARENARRIVRDGKRAAEVIARIRALSKRATTARDRLDLNETIQDVLALVGDEAKRTSVLIRTQFADDLSPVSADRVQLQQVVLNLVMNAIEAMSSVGDRARELVITTRNFDPDLVQVTVEDSGIGIDAQTMDKIFDPFYTTKPGGMGMGLSICRSILQAHGGRLWATAKDGGTIFHFTLPKWREEQSYAGIAGV